MTIYIATLYRFGYDLTAAGLSEQEARDTVITAYIKAFKDLNNGADPSEGERYDGETYLSMAVEDVEIREFTPGEVQWL